MLYFGNPCSEDIRRHMSAGDLGCIVTPRQGNKIPPGAPWMADNGRFSAQVADDGTPLIGDLSPGWPGEIKYVAWLAARRHLAPACWLAVAPDQPYDMAATLGLAGRWLYEIRRMGFPAALALQNGAEDERIPWADCDGVFIAGDSEWKFSPAASHLLREARARGKRGHVGRVNGRGKLFRAFGMDADAVDGGYFRSGPDKNLSRMLGWLDDLSYRGAQMVI